MLEDTPVIQRFDTANGYGDLGEFLGTVLAVVAGIVILLRWLA
jgi:hypothetical protein